MLLAYGYCFGPQSPHPELCLISEKPDQMTCMVRVDSLIQTDCAVIRVGPNEAVKVWRDEQENSFTIDAAVPSRLFLTPLQPDRPGFEVRRIKVVTLGPQKHQVFYKQDPKEANWREWTPNETQA